MDDEAICLLVKVWGLLRPLQGLAMTYFDTKKTARTCLAENFKTLPRLLFNRTLLTSPGGTSSSSLSVPESKGLLPP